ncbi:MAG: AIR synthase [Lachnospiraceae bacterium]|nr:AIR synthase [Lachnospiraceae bacterium]
MRKIERENSGRMEAGQDLVVAGYAGLAGTWEILKAKRQELLQWFSAEYLDMAEEEAAENQETEGREGLSFWEAFGAAECEPMGEGGILAAIWNLSGAYESGVEFALREIPIRQVTIEVCERYELNPYRLFSAGCYLLAAENGGQLVRRLQEAQIPAGVVGKVNRGIAREMIKDGGRGFLERPQKDELYKLFPKQEGNQS